MGKHTPGPWRVSETRGDKIAIAHDVKDAGAISLNLAWVIARQSWISEAEANASLIAAAPDLLEALKLVEKRCGPLSKDGRMARAAIAKAEGRSDE